MGNENSETTASKKSASEKRASTTRKEAAAKKTSTGSKTASKTTRTPKAKTVPNAGGKTGPKKKATGKALLLKKFDGPQPPELYRPKAAAAPVKSDPPPFVTADTEAEAARIRKLLFKKFDLSESETPSTDPKAAPEAGKIPPPPGPPASPKRTEPPGTPLTLALIGFALLVALMVKVSATNRSHYYVKPTGSGIEIWQGIFAPMGQERLIGLENADAPETVRRAYDKEQAYSLIFDHYMKRADALLEEPGTPDLEKIKSHLNQAMPYAVTEKHRTSATARLNNIDQLIYLIKADAAAGKETIADYETALEYLRQAQHLDVDGSKSALIAEKIAAVESAKSALQKEKEQEEKTAEPAAPPAK